MMQRLLPYELQQYLPDEVVKPIIELCSFFKKIYSVTLMEDNMLKAQSKMVNILCNLKLIYPPAFFDIMIHLLIHLPLEALEGGPIRPRLMYPFESKFPNKDMKEEFPGWFRSQIRQRYVDKDPSVNASNELFALAGGPTPTPISVNSCVVNSMRFVVHSSDERRTTQNSGICSPSGEDGEMYYGQLQEILEFSYLLFKVVFSELSDIIDVDEDDDIIDDEDALPYDLANSDNEELVNVEDDDVAVIYSSKGTRKPNCGGRKAGRLHTRQETQNLGLKKITDVHGPVQIRFEWNDIETLMPLGDHAAHWANYLWELVKELPMHYLSWRQVPAERKAGILAKIWTQFDLKPHIESEHWPKIYTGIQHHLQKIYNGNKSALKAKHWVPNPETGTYDVESIRQGHGELRYSRVPVVDPDLLPQTLLPGYSRGMRTELYMLQGLGTNTETGVPYIEDKIMVIIRKCKQRGHLLGVGRVLLGHSTDVLSPPPPSPRCTQPSDVQKLKKSNKLLTKQPEFGGGSGSGGCEDDESGDDEDGDEDDEDEEDADS
nr:hypothetical protein [Tanacetum cinerariifolium]